MKLSDFPNAVRMELDCDMDFHIPFSHRFGFELPESVKQKSMDLMLKEMEEAGIDKIVVPARKSYNVTNDDLTGTVLHRDIRHEPESKRGREIFWQRDRQFQDCCIRRNIPTNSTVWPVLTQWMVKKH